MKRLFIVVMVCCACFVQAQQTSPALANASAPKIIDGVFDDWKTEKIYNLTHRFDDRAVNATDLSASFRLAYNLDEQSIYIALKVVDSDQVVLTQNEEGAEDYALVYIDVQHSKQGGNNVRFIASQHQRSVEKQRPGLDAVNQHLSWKQSEVKVVRDGNNINYEWRIFIGDQLQVGLPLGIDFFIEDIDEGKEDSNLLTWSAGFGKSRNAILLGEVLPIDDTTSLGTINGQIIQERDTLDAGIKRIMLVSESDERIWFQPSLDANGNFKAQVPEGRYRIHPTSKMSTDIFSGAYHTYPKQLHIEKGRSISVVKGKITTIEPIQLTTIPLPTTVFKGKGLLFEDVFDSQRMDQFIEIYQDYFNIPGVSVALIKDGKMIYHKVRGVKNTQTGEVLDDRTVFEAASISKAIFSIIVLRLEERGLIDLDKPLYEYLPYPNLEKDPGYKLLTARIVMNHQTGLPNWAFWPPDAWESGGEISLNFTPGTQFGYSGEGMNYLGRVVAAISGKSVSELFQEEIAEPFGLENTYFTYNSSITNASRGHYQTYPRYKERTVLDSPASSVWSEAADLSKFIIGLINEEHLRKEGYQSIYTPQTILEGKQKLYDPEMPQGVANGFFVQETPQGKILGHGGNNDDFECKFGYIKDKKVGYVVFTNNNYGDDFIRLLELFVLRGSTTDY